MLIFQVSCRWGGAGRPAFGRPPLAMVLRVNGSDQMAGEESFTAEAQRAQRKTTYE